MPLKAICPICGKSFSHPPSYKKKFCSRDCFNKREPIPLADRTCLECGISFQISQREANLGKGIFCSKSCRATNQNRTGTVTMHCPQCGKPFVVKPGRVRLRTHCSLECAADALRKEYVKKTCGICGTIFHVKPSVASKSFYCSHECNGVAQQLALASRKKPSSIELIMMDELDRRSILYEHQYRVGRALPDIAFPSILLAVECDGDYWHNRPGEQEHDRKRDARLAALGWTVIRFWERDIRADVSKCVDEIERVIRERNLIPKPER